MRLLDYIFYKISRPYVNGFVTAPHSEMWASMLFAVIILLNLFTASLIFDWPNSTDSILGIFSFLIMTFFHFRYNEKRLDLLEKRYSKENQTRKIIGGLLVFIYVFGSLFFFLWLITRPHG